MFRSACPEAGTRETKTTQNDRVMIQSILKVLILPLLFTSGEVRNLTYTLGEESWLRLSGTSSVNCFECISFSELSKGKMEVVVDDSAETITFSNALLNIRVKSFDCLNPRLNKDMHNALGVEQHPHISVELLEVVNPDKSNQNRGGSINAKVSLNLNGNSKVVEIPVKWLAEGDDKYRFSGSSVLRMSDFGISPPSPFFGLIKVNNEIEISFSLSVAVEQV